MGSSASATRATHHTFIGGGFGDDPEEDPVKSFFASDENGETFSQIVENKTRYGDLFETPSRYEVYVNHSGHHWYLLLRLEQSKLPFMTLEIITTDGQTIKPLVCIQKDDTGKQHYTTMEGNMHEFCSLADTFIKEMRRYDAHKKNSQHFCNAFLGSFGLPSIETTVGPTIPDGFPTIPDGFSVSAQATAAVPDCNFDRSETVQESLPNRCQK